MSEAELMPAAGAAQVAAPPFPIGTDCFLDRDLSWLQFNLRVLREAGERTVPLLERLKYLRIYQNNLDEFFMVRVGSLMHRGVLFPDETDRKTGWTPSEALKQTLNEVRRQQDAVKNVWRQLLRDMKAEKIEVLDFNHASKADESLAHKLFADLRQLLSPRIVDAEHPMPFVDDRQPCLAVLLKREGKLNLGLVDLSRLPVCRVFESDGVQKVVLIDELVRHYAPQLFKRYSVKDACILRVTRNADVLIAESSAKIDGDARRSMEKLLRKRQRQEIVRMELYGCSERQLEEKLEKYLRVSKKRTFEAAVPPRLDFGSLLTAKPAWKFSEQHSVRTVLLRKGDYFRYLEQKDLLMSFPFQSITPFIEMLYEAADDPEVISIRITLYRLAASSKLAAALAYAADRGKDVLCVLELRARFDEKNNIDYSEVLEEAGCSVIYGLPGMKVHSKLCLITRKCGDSVKYITQVGTGNYNEVTSEQYCDLSLITADQQIGRDAAAIFDALALGQAPEPTEKLVSAPCGFKPLVLQMLDQEIRRGSEGFVSIKVNSMNDLDVMTKLIECSRAGVTVECFIRGICCLRPGLAGYTDRLRVRSVVGRYLEHSRIFVFGRGEGQRIFIGSGDLLNRNTQWRIEAFIEVTTPETRSQVLEIMDALRRDDVKGWDMQPDGSYGKTDWPRGTSSQEALYRHFSQRQVKPLVRRNRLRCWIDALMRRKS